MAKIIKDAHAKINLGLDVIRKREDGYHEVKMIMQMLGLHDTLTFETRDDLEIEITSNSGKLPLDEHNLIYKAAKVFFDETKEPFGVSIYLEKRIPIAAGMAGGSTDAAATFLALNEMSKQPLTMDSLLDISVKVGADVPYCILGGTTLSEGIGEILTPIKGIPQTCVLIAKPNIDVSTAFVYKNLKAAELPYHPDIDGMKQAIENGNLDGITSRMGNVLETVTVPAYPIIGEIKKTCVEQGAINSLMSGSGPTVFAIFDDEEKAKKAAEYVRNLYQINEVYVTDFYGIEE